VRPGSASAARRVVLPYLVAALPIALAVALCATPGIADRWRVLAVLSAVAVAGIVAGHQSGTPVRTAAQPWNVHTVWLVPAVLLAPPQVFSILIGLSLAVTLSATGLPRRLRLLVATNNLVGCGLIYLAVLTTNTPRAAVLLGMPLVLAVTAVVAVVGTRLVQPEPARTTFADFHWAAIETCAALTGCLITVAMSGHPLAGLAGVAPMVLAVFALRWPELTSQARTDAKTGLPNAGRWEELSRHALNDSAIRRRPAALLIIDIDHFKAVNDTYGHLAGDVILAAVAADILAELGPDDLVGRFGGEEFVVTTIGLSRAEAMVLAERIRRRIAGTSHEIISLEGHRTTAGPVTCTIGVASSEVLGYGHTLLLRRADAALAGGKIGGRNQIRSAEWPEAIDWTPLTSGEHTGRGQTFVPSQRTSPTSDS
jgi:diguanylate cyclase (GGDEF)-like protein